jgi:CRISPR-associated protein Cmr1
METLDCTVRFTTPAFLGGADQGAQWRTPPFKALLRQWWRVAECCGKEPDLAKLHQREGELFGRAADQGTTASRVRLRLGDWRTASLKSAQWQGLGAVDHPEVKQKPPADLYLGYGPVQTSGRRDAIRPGDPRLLRVGMPQGEAAVFQAALRLCHAFGALGSRCRNGWGSLHFERGGLSPAELAAVLDPSSRAGRDWLRTYARDWQAALCADWCHALGKDEQGLLLWRTKGVEERWEDVLRHLAEVKIAFRTQFHFKGGGPHAALCDRQILAYPITKHSLTAWGHDARNANQMFFKVLPVGRGYAGLVVHLPQGLPGKLKSGLTPADREGLTEKEKEVWPKVHQVLDQRLTRLP